MGQWLMDLLAVGYNGYYMDFEPSAACTAYAGQLIVLNAIKNFTVVNEMLSDSRRLLRLHIENCSCIDTNATLLRALRPDREY